VKLVKKALDFLQDFLPRDFKLSLEPPDVVVQYSGRVVIKRVLVCRDVDYSLDDLSEASARTLLETYTALLQSLPEGVHIHIFKEEFNIEGYMKRLVNDILNTQVDLESTRDEVRRVKLEAKLHKLKSIYEALVKGKPFIRSTLVVAFSVSDSSLSRAKSLADYYEALITDLFQKNLNFQLSRATRNEIVKYILEFLGLSKHSHSSPVILEASKLSAFQPLVLDKFTPISGVVVIGFSKDTLHPIGLRPEDFYYHLAVIGPTGRGKTTLLAGIIEQVLADSNTRVFAVDFKGDLESYLRPGIVEVAKPEDMPLNFLKTPPGVSSIDWRGVVLDALSHVTSLPPDKVSRALSSLERSSSLEYALKSQVASLLIHFLEFVGGEVDYTRLQDVYRRGVVVSLKSRGVVFQNTYASLFIGLLRYVLLRESSDHGALLVLDDAWRVLKSRFIVELVREGRSRKVGVVISTQTPEDMPVEILENVNHYVVFGSRNRDYIDKIRRILGLKEEHANALFKLSVGEAVYANTITRRTEIITTAKPYKLAKSPS
jgi:energy-coupling factor transporter ATP-binding protein EcfA2